MEWELMINVGVPLKKNSPPWDGIINGVGVND